MSNGDNLRKLMELGVYTSRNLAVIKTLNFSVFPSTTQPGTLETLGVPNWGYFIPNDVAARELLSDNNIIAARYSEPDFHYHYKYVGGLHKDGRTWKPHMQANWNSLLDYGVQLSSLCKICLAPSKGKEKVLAIEALLNSLSEGGEDSIECISVLSRALVQVIVCLKSNKKVEVVPTDSTHPLDVFMCKIVERAFGE